jgi:hypothetical protein
MEEKIGGFDSTCAKFMPKIYYNIGFREKRQFFQW